MPTLQEALDTYLLVQRRPQTNQQYRLILSRLVAAIGPSRNIQRIRFEDLLDYQASLSDLVSPVTVAGYTSIFKAFFSWCTRQRYVDFNPALELHHPRTRRDPEDSRAIPSADLRRFVEYTRITKPRNYAMLLFMADTGCRVGGLVSLTLLHLHLGERFAFIDEKGGQWHRATFGDETAAALQAWIAKRPRCLHDYVWTGRGPDYKPIKRAAVEAILSDLSERTGASKKWTPHSLRHALGHAWAKAGIPPHVTQEKLGHAHISTTLNFYYPQRDPYVEIASRRYALASLKDDAELHRGTQIIDVVDTPPRRAKA